jgi:hypothetical protein
MRPGWILLAIALWTAAVPAGATAPLETCDSTTPLGAGDVDASTSVSSSPQGLIETVTVTPSRSR